ncbi:DUF3006 family protein [Candidatus Fermentibacterales bacterium]|nr:DUF3006 family protein [Candidatus Fermentibacterales bacterium]
MWALPQPEEGWRLPLPDAASRVSTGTVDRIEGETAVILLDGGGRLLLPLALLTEGAAEGSVLRIEIAVDAEESAARLDRIRDLRRELLERHESDD